MDRISAVSTQPVAPHAPAGPAVQHPPQEKAAAAEVRTPEKATLSPQARFEAAGEAFGKALAGLSPQQKQDMTQMRARVDEYAKEMEAKGQPVDRASTFVGGAMKYAFNGLSTNPNDAGLDKLFGTGAEFIDAQHALIKK